MSCPKGNLFILTAPSGTGKTTISRSLTNEGLVSLSISHTTRLPRGAEKNGKEYFFVDETTFLNMINTGSFFEWARVYGHYYGTSIDWVEKMLGEKKNVLLEIDTQGALEVKKKKPDAISFFILPPSIDVLKERLHQRGEDSEETINLRLSQITAEIVQKKHFDYVIINDDLSTAIGQIRDIIKG